jgi:hypothetical protein
MEALVGLLLTLLAVVMALLLVEIACFGVLMTCTWRNGRQSTERSHGHGGLLR